MSQTVRFRPARASERFESYAFLLSWPLVFSLPYGSWTWAFIFAPTLIVDAMRFTWRARKPIVANARRSGSGVGLFDDGGQRLEGFEDSEVEAVTSLVDPKRPIVDLRVDRKGKRALIFELKTADEAAAVAKRLGIDIEGARSRYTATSLAARRLAIPFVAGAICALYALFGSPEPETAAWLNQLIRFGFLPVLVMTSIPSVIDVGHDGVAWRWLWIRRYVAWTSIASMRPSPASATGAKVASMRMTTRSGETLELPLGARAAGASAHLLAAFAAKSKAPPPVVVVEEWLPRTAGEGASIWIQRLRAKSADGGTYRGNDVRHLWPLAEDPSTPHDLRCAMLLILATSDEARARTRALATSIVDPDVRAVFDAIADGVPDEAVALLLERVSRVATASGSPDEDRVARTALL